MNGPIETMIERRLRHTEEVVCHLEEETKRARNMIRALFLTVIAVGIVSWLGATWVAGQAATSQTEDARKAAIVSARLLYKNALSACAQSNPLREAVALAISTAATSSPNMQSRAIYRDALSRQLTQPFIRPNGSKECLFAVQKPFLPIDHKP